MGNLKKNIVPKAMHMTLAGRNSLNVFRFARFRRITALRKIENNLDGNLLLDFTLESVMTQSTGTV
jgi:hypothetical protein